MAESYIIALSGYADAKSRTRAIEVGCDEFIAKPCIPRDLVARVRAALRGDP
jgi:DNA-binding response OmpR family regulator